MIRSVHAWWRKYRGFREWRAQNPAGSILLGFMTKKEAVAFAATLGKISYVDETHAIIFYDTHEGHHAGNTSLPF